MGDRLGIHGVVCILVLNSFSSADITKPVKSHRIESNFLKSTKCTKNKDVYMVCAHLSCIRPYHVENTSSRLITEVKQHWAALVLGWVTAWEYAVLYAF